MKNDKPVKKKKQIFLGFRKELGRPPMVLYEESAGVRMRGGLE